MTQERRTQEIKEAVRAGEKALISLGEAKRQLESARNWGIWDMIGGGLISSMIKHSRLDDASACLENAKMDLKIFHKELKDISDLSQMGIDIGGFLSFADIFLDGIVADWMVQRKIDEARDQVDRVIRRVESLVRELKAEKGV